MIATVALQQIQSLRRQRILSAYVAVVLAMTAMAGVIGWSSHRTIIRVYNEAIALLATQGREAPPNPFLLKPTLSLLSNMSIYIPLIGALLAIIVGHFAMADDQAGGLGRLVFSRPISRGGYVAGKLVGAATVTAMVVVASFVASLVALFIANGSAPGLGDIGRLVIFYALSWLYLTLFCVVGMATMLFTRRRALALLIALGIWLVVTFAVPQFTSGLRPTTSLNPIIDPVSTSQTFFKITAKARVLSLSEQYKAASAQILQTASGESTVHVLGRVLVIVAVLGALALLTLRLIARHDYSRSSADD